MNYRFASRLAAAAVTVAFCLSGCSGSGAGSSGAVDEGVSGKIAPTARADALVMVAGETTTADLFACSGFGPDDLGNPQAVVVSYGGEGSPFSTTAAGQTVSASDTNGLAEVTLFSDGNLTIVPPASASGDFSVEYELANSAGTGTAGVAVFVASHPFPPGGGS